MLSSKCKEWIQSASDDFVVIDSIYANAQVTRRRPHRQVLYHSQQAAEKMLKAYLVHHGLFPWGHDLNALRTDCAKFNSGFNSKRIIDHCAFLTAFNEARYPDFSVVIDAVTASRSLNSAKRISIFVVERLGAINEVLWF